MPDDAPKTIAPISLKQAIAEVEERIARAKVRTSPFPHLVVDDLLPAPVRRMLDRHWPDARRMTASNHSRRAEIRVSKLALAQQASDGERMFWRSLHHLAVVAGLAARARLARHVGDKYRAQIGPDWRRRLGTPGWLPGDAMLANYGGVVELAPHVDHSRVVVNGFVYLDDPGQPTPEPRRGTMLYRSLGFAWPSNSTIPPPLRERFLREAEDVVWRDNRLLAYVNGPWSFHGVPRHDLGTGRRRLLMFGSLLDQATTDRVFDAAIR